MKARKLRIALLIAVVAVTTVSVQSAVAHNERPAWHVNAQSHVGPAGVSVRPDITSRLERSKDRIVSKLENSRIPSEHKEDIIQRIMSLFDGLIARFS